MVGEGSLHACLLVAVAGTRVQLGKMDVFVNSECAELLRSVENEKKETEENRFLDVERFSPNLPGEDAANVHSRDGNASRDTTDTSDAAAGNSGGRARSACRETEDWRQGSCVLGGCHRRHRGRHPDTPAFRCTADGDHRRLCDPSAAGANRRSVDVADRCHFPWAILNFAQRCWPVSRHANFQFSILYGLLPLLLAYPSPHFPFFSPLGCPLARLQTVSRR
jgi:hypothetical protein